jgi:hypothetical protein
MKCFKFLLVSLIILTNLIVTRPSFADRPKFTQNPDYIEITKTLDQLLAAKKEQSSVDDLTPEELQQKINALEFQKYTLETGLDWGQCSNETGSTLAVYGPIPKGDDDDDYEDYPYPNTLYFLANGKATQNNWDCDGVYLPSDAKALVGESAQELMGPVAIKIVDGTKLVIKTNSRGSAIEFNVPSARSVERKLKTERKGDRK